MGFITVMTLEMEERQKIEAKQRNPLSSTINSSSSPEKNAQHLTHHSKTNEFTDK